MTAKALEGRFGIDRAKAEDSSAGEERPQGALFEIEVDDDDGCAWIVVDGQAVNLGPEDAVTEKLAAWLAARPRPEKS